MPVQEVGEDPAEQDAEGAAAGGDEAEHAHGLRPLGRLDEERHHERECDRRHYGAAESLDHPGHDEHALACRRPARERSQGEQGDPAEEQSTMAEQIAEPPAQQQEAPEGQKVAVHHPGERGLGEAEILLDRGQRHVHDRAVENDHQRAQAENYQGEPARAAIGAS